MLSKHLFMIHPDLGFPPGSAHNFDRSACFVLE
jgi:hypothetical protein